MNNPFDYVPGEACRLAFRRLIADLEKLKESGNASDIRFLRELEDGKMLGVLIAKDDSGASHTLYAFSGQLGEGGFFHPGFVEPVFDYLQPGCYFKVHEADISRQNAEISLFESTEFVKIKRQYEQAKEKNDAEIAIHKEKLVSAKKARDAKRNSGVADKNELDAMIRESQFEKSEFHRLKKRLATELDPFAADLDKAKSHLDTMKAKRRADSEALQNWLFSNFEVLNARGEARSLSDIFADTSMRVPPSGAGECCAPKLLQAAYRRGWHPEEIAEFWYGKSKDGEVRIHGEHYPACRGKCLPLLGWMLQGLDIEPPLGDDRVADITVLPEIVFENEWFCIVDKPSGMVSVSGKGAAISVEEWLRKKYGPDRDVKMAHRLDQDTSGLLVATFGAESYKIMQTLFATRKVKKTYVAELDGDYESRGIKPKGRIELPLSPDWLDRPRQKVDMKSGKEAVTDYEFTGVSEGRSRVKFYPLTGRTHQLRVHAASQSGLGMPISNDRLYGHAGNSYNRLRLHAHRLEFIFPADGNHYSFESPLPF